MKKYIIAAVVSAVLFCTINPDINNQASAEQKQTQHTVSAATPEKVAPSSSEIPNNSKITAIPESETEQPPITPKDQAKATLQDLGIADAWCAVEYIAFKESSWNPAAHNSIGACGLFQAYPCSKLNCNLSDVACQVRWATSYANQRYGSWHYAYVFWRNNGWW